MIDGITFHNNLQDIDWPTLKRDLAADRLDNGRSAEQLRRSFEVSRSSRSRGRLDGWSGQPGRSPTACAMRT